MHHTLHETAQQITLQPTVPATGSIIWLHGLGASGHDFVPIVPMLDLPAQFAIRFIFPHAQRRPITINQGYVMPAWYDIQALSLQAAEDAAGIRASTARITELIEQERAQGIAAERIILAGFSQGGAVALHTALQYAQCLGGVMALSTYLPLRATLHTDCTASSKALSILMCHGLHDPVVPLALATHSRDCLQQAGYKVEWREYAMQHTTCTAEIADLAAWIKLRFSS